MKSEEGPRPWGEAWGQRGSKDQLIPTCTSGKGAVSGREGHACLVDERWSSQRNRATDKDDCGSRSLTNFYRDLCRRSSRSLLRWCNLGAGVSI